MESNHHRQQVPRIPQRESRTLDFSNNHNGEFICQKTSFTQIPYNNNNNSRFSATDVFNQRNGKEFLQLSTSATAMASQSLLLPSTTTTAAMTTTQLDYQNQAKHYMFKNNKNDSSFFVHPLRFAADLNSPLSPTFKRLRTTETRDDHGSDVNNKILGKNNNTHDY